MDTDGPDGSKTVHRTRREFVKLAGAAGLTGCVGETDTTTDGVLTDEFSTLVATWRGNDPTATVTLQWLTSRDSPPDTVDVVLSSDTDVSETRTEVAGFGEDGGLHRHRGVVTGLTDDTLYEITVDGKDVGASVRTAPESLTEPLVFAEGGDVGTSSNVPMLHGKASGWDPLFGLVGGDLAYANGRDPDKWITFLEHWSEHMRSGDRLIPIVAAVGNHEVRGGMGGSPGDAPFFYTLFDNPQREHAYWALDLGDYASILILDSNHTTEVAGDQTEWFEKALDERKDRQHLMAAYHVPAYPSAKPIDARNREDIRENWVPLMEEYGVDVAFEHDDHTYKRTHPLRGGEPAEKGNGVVYLGDGAWGRGPRDAKSPSERPYLAVSRSKLNVIRSELSPDGTRRFRAVDTEEDVIDELEMNDGGG